MAMTPDEFMKTAMAEAFASCPADEIVLYTVEFRHPTFDVPARVVCWPITDNDPTKFKLRLESTAPENPNEIVEFIGLPFNLTFPAQEENAPGQFVLRMENVGSVLSGDLLSAVKQREPVRVIFREYLKHIPEYPQSVYVDFSIAEATVSNNNVEGTATMIDWLLRRGGRKYYPSDFPGLVRGR